MRVIPFDASLGAEITGIDLASDLDAGTSKKLNEYWAEHLVLCIRGQNLSPQDFIKAGRIFGDPFRQILFNTDGPMRETTGKKPVGRPRIRWYQQAMKVVGVDGM